MQRIINYGSFLQAYSLKKTIESMGHTVEFVDYTIEPTVISEEDKKEETFLSFIYKIPGIIKKIAKAVLRPFYRKIRAVLRPKSDISTWHTKVSREISEFLQLSKKYNYRAKVDLLIIGSDEVFNCLQSNKSVGYSMELFGKDNNAGRLISYAASFGNTTIERLRKYKADIEVAGHLKNFDEISVRDQNSGNIVEILTGKKPLYHLDPVFIYDYEKEMSFTVDINNYIIVYAYSNRISKEEGESIVNFARSENKKIVCLGNHQNFCDIYIPATAFDMLCYFKHADYVITDTFHGTVFSIKFNRPFTTIIRETKENSYGNAEKLSDLLMRFSFEERISSQASDIERVLKTPINFEDANKKISDETDNSRQYLSKYTCMNNHT